MYADPATAEVAGLFLNPSLVKTVEDWGCGRGGFADFLDKKQTYVGVDGSKSPFADKIADLTGYTSKIEAIHMRHVLEHNPEWKKILCNALKSFNKYMVLTIFTPYQNKTKIINEYDNFNNTGISMCDIGFSREDIVECFGEIPFFAIENLTTDSQYNIEHMFFLSKIEDHSFLDEKATSAFDIVGGR